MAMIISFTTFAATGLIVKLDDTPTNLSKKEEPQDYNGFTDDEMISLIFGEDIFDTNL